MHPQSCAGGDRDYRFGIAIGMDDLPADSDLHPIGRALLS
jgi:hypothetical protein